MVTSSISITGTGHRLPDRSVTNAELCRVLDVTPEWIESRTGIKSRLIAEDHESASQYALEAASAALESAGRTAADVGLIIVATFSGDYVFPAAAVKLQGDLGATGAHAFDVQANCSGFVTALVLARDRMAMEQSIKCAVVVGLEFCSRYTDSTDPNVAVYLSDGAGAVVLERSELPGYLSSSFWTESSNYESVRLRGGGSNFRRPEYYDSSRFMEMNGLATWKQAITWLPKVVRDASSRVGLSSEDIDVFIFHQANLRLIEYLVQKLGHSMSSTYTNVERIGNTGAASIAVALSEARSASAVKPGDLVCIAGVGAGFTFGASLWRWTAHPR